MKWIAFLLTVTITSQLMPPAAFDNAGVQWGGGTQGAGNAWFADDTQSQDNLWVVGKSGIRTIQERITELLNRLASELSGSPTRPLETDIGALRGLIDELREASMDQVTADREAAEAIMTPDIGSAFESQNGILSLGFREAAAKADLLEKSLRSGSTDFSLALIGEIADMVAPEAFNPLNANLPQSRVQLNPNVEYTDATVPAGQAQEQASALAQVSAPTQAPVPARAAPTAEDLMVTADTEISDEIKDLIRDMSAVDIYEYVRNNIDYEPYYGSKKGATAVFDQGSGNDCDTASLLIGMLRFKGVPSSYERGTVEMTADQAMALTAAKTPMAAASALAAMGVPTTALISKAVISGVRVERVWVNAYIAYDNYRGAGDGSGERTWIPMDASFKRYSLIEGLDMKESLGLDIADATAVVSDSIAFSGSSFMLRPMNLESIGADINGSPDKVARYIADNGLEDGDLTDICGGKRIQTESLGYLSPTLQYKVTQSLGTFTGIPNSSKERITFSIDGGSLSYSVSLSELYDRRVTLTWEPATPDDSSIIERYGSIFETPAYLVSMKPQLNIDGATVAVGSPVGLGKAQTLSMRFDMPGMPKEYTSNILTAGGIYCIVFNHGSTSTNELLSISGNLDRLKDTAVEEDTYSDALLGEILHAVGQAYFAAVDFGSLILSGQYGVIKGRVSSKLVTGYGISASALFGSPVRVNEGGLFIDADRNRLSAVSADGDRDQELNYMYALGFISSYMEHTVLEHLTEVPSVSTVKVFQVAMERNIPMHTVTKGNMNETLPKLALPQAVKNDIRNAVGSGMVVTVPERSLQYHGWKGTAYQVIDPVTGANAYMLSGGTAGGETTVRFMIGEYFKRVRDGSFSSLMFVLVVTLLPTGPASAIATLGMIVAFWMIVFAFYKVLFLCFMYEATGNVAFLQEAVLEVAVLVTVAALTSPISARLEMNGWRNPDGSIREPDLSGDLPGSEIIIHLTEKQVIKVFGHSENTDTAYPAAADIDTLSLPPTVDSSAFMLYEVTESFEVVQTTVAPFGGSPGGGTKYYLPERVIVLITLGYLALLLD